MKNRDIFVLERNPKPIISIDKQRPLVRPLGLL
jgi:hypothetical protein